MTLVSALFKGRSLYIVKGEAGWTQKSEGPSAGTVYGPLII